MSPPARLRRAAHSLRPLAPPTACARPRRTAHKPRAIDNNLRGPQRRRPPTGPAWRASRARPGAGTPSGDLRPPHRRTPRCRTQRSTLHDRRCLAAGSIVHVPNPHALGLFAVSLLAALFLVADPLAAGLLSQDFMLQNPLAKLPISNLSVN